MTQLYQRNLARHVRLARQGNGNHSDDAGGLDAVPPPSSPTTTGSSNGNRSDNDGSGSVSLTSGPTTTDALTSPTSVSATSPSVSPTPTSSAPSITPSSVQSTSSSSSVVQSSTTLSSSPTSTLTPTSALPTDSTLSSSSTFSSAESIVLQQTPTTTTFSNLLANPDEITPTPSYGTQTNVFSPVTTVSASALPETSSNVSAGNIVGAVVGTIIGLALLVVLVAFILRRYRRSRRRAMRDSDFGTFRRSMFVTPRSSATPTRGSMTETSHNVTPSLKEPYIPYSARTAKQPSQTPAAATSAATAASVLQERPKYVYGQGVTTTSEKQQDQDQDQQQQQQHDDAVSDAHGGAYSSEPQVQNAYNPEAYGHYAKYEDIGDGVVGGVPAGTTLYQDAERAYQGQQGYNQGHYDAAHYASYDRSQYHGYGQQQQQAYGHSSQYPQAQVPESKGPAGTYVAF